MKSEEDYDVIFFNNCYSCPSIVQDRPDKESMCEANRSGICCQSDCPFLFWIKVQEVEI